MGVVARVAVVFILLLSTEAAGVASAQVPPTGAPEAITGIVVDSTGGAIAGAEVILIPQGDTRRQTVTNGSGQFVFEGVPAGPATLTAAFSRFAPLTVDVGATRTNTRMVLLAAGVREDVTVEAPALTTSRITTATRTDTLLRDVPQSVTVVTRGLIADQSMKSMGDVVRYVPGVGMAQGEGHRDAPIFRGNTSTADFFVDGVRDDTQYFRDLYNVERVEALKGPNGMVFGRGGVGGVINRVTRQADWMPSREVTFQGGSWSNRRLSGDVGHAWNPRVAGRFTGVYENSDSYRTDVNVERYGLNPTVAFTIGPATTLRAGYEFFDERRTTDRGVPSFNGLPLDVDRSTFFGNAAASNADITFHAFSSTLEHRFSDRLTVRSRLGYADYDKFYQNIFAGAVNAARTTVSLSGYNSGTDRKNLFNQTDLLLSSRTGRFPHTVVVGTELGRQVTDNLRLTAFFTSIGPTTTSIATPIENPVTSLPVTFRASASDAENRGVATVAAVYAQDQVTLSRHVQAVVGLRYDRFAVDLRNNRTGTNLSSDDGLLSPRLGLIVKPVEPVSLYASYTLSYLPRAGEQLASLSPTNQALEPETFRNYEVGAKWDVLPALSFSTAVYHLDRGNVAVPDPLDPARSLLVDGQRTVGLEVELGGKVSERWSLFAGYALQDGEITRSLSSAALAGARLAQVPRHSFSLWNRYDVTQTWGVGLGVIAQGDRFVATDNLVALPAFARVDTALFVRLTPRVRAQINVENLLDERYYSSAHNNNNITPGSPRALRVSLTTGF